MKKLSSLSIFFPCYNDAKIMPYLISKANTIAKKITSNYEIIVINDKSTDDSKVILEQLKTTYKKLVVVNHKKNKGYGGALISGLKAAKKDWVFYTDGDGQYDPDDLLLLVKTLDAKTDVVNGYKLKRGDSMLRVFTGFMNNAVIHLFFNLPIRDIDCDFRLMRRRLVSSLKLDANSGTICTELIVKLKKKGATFKEVGVKHYPRLFGKSQFFSVLNILKTMRDNLNLYSEVKKEAVSATGFEPVTTRL